MSKFIDLTGQTFGAWTVTGEPRRDGHRTFWRCQCSCGEVAEVRGDSLRGGQTVQCALCHRRTAAKTHGLAGTPTWLSWQAMRNRCLCEGSADYARYGGAGVTITPRWDDYLVFLSDMGERPTGKTLDRIDVTRGYEPDNCRWATPKQQGRNRHRTVWLTANGKRQSITDWADELGFLPITLYKRHVAGWSDADVVNTPKLTAAEGGVRSGAARRQAARISAPSPE